MARTAPGMAAATNPFVSTPSAIATQAMSIQRRSLDRPSAGRSTPPDSP